MSSELTWTTVYWTEQYELAVKVAFMKQSGCLWILSNWDLNNSALSLTQLRKEKYSSSFFSFLIMTDNLNSLLGGYSCLIIGVIGTLVNLVVLLVLSSERQLSSQPTTAVLVVITGLNILYNGLILPAQSLMYLERRLLTELWRQNITHSVFPVFSQTNRFGVRCSPSLSTPTWVASCWCSVSSHCVGSCLSAPRPGEPSLTESQ